MGDGAWIAAGAGFLGGVVILGLITSLVVLMDIRMELTQTTRRQRRGRPEPDERTASAVWESKRREKRTRDSWDDMGAVDRADVQEEP